MSAGLFGLLDDVAALARLAAASVDDIGAAAGRATAKAAGVVIDDTAVTPQYVHGVTADRELPMIKRIAIGSLRNKLVFILPAALLLSQFVPWLLTPILMIGATYLCYEGAEKVVGRLHRSARHDGHAAPTATVGEDAEKQMTSGAIRTDFILSAEIMAIALASLEHLNLITTALALLVVALAITIGVYGVVALIVKLDDIGLHLAQRSSPGVRRFGNALVRVVPNMLTALAAIGTAAMLWVGGGILVHGLEELGVLEIVPRAIHAIGDAAARSSGPFSGVVKWLVGAVGGAIVGLAIGGIIALVVRRITSRPEELIVD
jgi:predicted DNA repair protein MutK